MKKLLIVLVILLWPVVGWGEDTLTVQAEGRFKLTVPQYNSITFACGEGEMILTWKTGKLDIIYNNCEQTEAAKIFFDFLISYGYPHDQSVKTKCHWKMRFFLLRDYMGQGISVSELVNKALKEYKNYEIGEVKTGIDINNRFWAVIWLKKKVCE